MQRTYRSTKTTAATAAISRSGGEEATRDDDDERRNMIGEAIGGWAFTTDEGTPLGAGGGRSVGGCGLSGV